jgi:apolipoprotein D and lipocalin family protein
MRILLLTAFASLFLVGCASTPTAMNLATVPQVDLNRFMGQWHVIAHIPYFLEKGKVDTSDIYALRPDGRIDNIFRFRKGSFDAPEQEWRGVAWVVNSQTNAEWKVQLLWPFKVGYLILELDPEYGWSIVGTPDGSKLWILSRSRHLSEDVYRDLLHRVEKRGYRPSSLVKVPQPEV